MSMPIHQEVTFDAKPEQLYEALLDQVQHASFTGGPAEISRDIGGAFSCHGGQIVGRNIELDPNKRIVQAWRVTAWPEGVYSVVKFEIEPVGTGTRLTLDHTGVPGDGRDAVADGWKSRYWEPLTDYLAY